MVYCNAKNNNLLNIKRSVDTFEGLCTEQKDPYFFQFISPEYSIKAAYKILCDYNQKYFCRTIGSLISKWAPPPENDTITYIKFVCSVCRCEPEHIVDIKDIDFMAKLIMAMTRMEKGSCPYTIDQIKKGIALKNVVDNC